MLSKGIEDERKAIGKIKIKKEEDQGIKCSILWSPLPTSNSVLLVTYFNCRCINPWTTWSHLTSGLFIQFPQIF